MSFDMGTMHEYPVAWDTFNSAVPIMSKVKVVPNIPRASGQIFLKKELATPAWDVTYQVSLDQSKDLKNLKLNEMVDMFACWFLLSAPKIRPGAQTNMTSFGFREYWSGVGVFVFKENDKYKIMAAQNHGSDQVTLASLGKSFNNGVNGCIISESEMEGLEKRFILHMRME